ncbi:MAG: hypothetical protein K2W92_08240 [Alphaproteobacteria bacterium]|nr:hypothetical protein [Alphaproteobacteria bacterium]
MPKKFLKTTVTIASFISLTLLGEAKTAWGMWDDLDESQRTKIVKTHINAIKAREETTLQEEKEFLQNTINNYEKIITAYNVKLDKIKRLTDLPDPTPKPVVTSVPKPLVLSPLPPLNFTPKPVVTSVPKPLVLSPLPPLNFTPNPVVTSVPEPLVIKPRPKLVLGSSYSQIMQSIKNEAQPELVFKPLRKLRLGNELSQGHEGTWDENYPNITIQETCTACKQEITTAYEAVLTQRRDKEDFERRIAQEVARQLALQNNTNAQLPPAPPQ